METPPRTNRPLMVLGLLLWTGPWLNAQVRILPTTPSPSVFSGGGREIPIQVQNPANTPVTVELGGRLLQLTSATAVPLGTLPARSLSVGPHQVVLDRVQVDLPPVRAETRFRIQWTTGGTNLVGRTDVWVYPTNLLAQLGTMGRNEAIGVHDPENRIKPALQSGAVRFEDLSGSDTATFEGRIAIFSASGSQSKVPPGMKTEILALARRGVAVIWFQPPPSRGDRLQPSFRVVQEGTGSIVLAGSDLIAGLAERPEAQLHLIGLVAEALNPKRAELPGAESPN